VIGAETSKPAREQAFWCIEHVFDVYLWGLGRLRPVRLVLGAPLGGVWFGSVERNACSQAGFGTYHVK
jgi:hypothetical protein